MLVLDSANPFAVDVTAGTSRRAWHNYLTYAQHKARDDKRDSEIVRDFPRAAAMADDVRAYAAMIAEESRRLAE